MSKILAAIEALGENMTHPKFMSEALTEIKGEIDTLKERVEGLGHEATGETGAATAALGERIDSLTSAFGSVGTLVSGFASRLEALESRASAPAVPPVVPPVTA